MEYDILESIYYQWTWKQTTTTLLSKLTHWSEDVWYIWQALINYISINQLILGLPLLVGQN
jgi:hypothetical protein